MNLDLSEGQTLLRDAVERLLSEESTPARVRQAEASGFDAKLWARLVELGVISMRVPDLGGYSLLDAALVAELAGRHLASAPIAEAIVARALMARIDTPEPLRSEVNAGAVVTLALKPVARNTPQGVPGGAAASVIVALDGDELVAFQLSGAQRRVADLAASAMALVDFDALDPRGRIVLARGSDAVDAFDAALEEWRLLNAAMLVGIGRRALELAAAHSLERVQFGKPIGTFQGVAHPLADSATDIDGAQLLLWRAIWGIAEDHDDAGACVSMARWFAGQAAERAAQRALRTFGGYGLSLEYDIQLYYRRAKLFTLIAGDPAAELDLVAERLWRGGKTALPPAGDIGVDFGFGVKAEAYAAELRAFVEANMTPEIEGKKHHSTSGHHPAFHKALAAAGHAFPDFEIEGRTPRSRYEVMAAAPLWEDLDWTRTPVGITEMVGKMCQLWSQDEAKAEILPRILGGEALGSLGFSEPGSGSDVFAARFSAIRDGDMWTMNGQKMFTTNAHNADYILLLTRSDPAAQKHQGLTMFIMPLKLSGVDIHAVHTLQDERTNIVYWSDVRVPDKYRIGDVGDGARVMASALGFEHGGSAYHAAQAAMLRHAVAWARKPRRGGVAPMEDPAVRRTLARAAVNNEVAEALCRREIWAEAENRHSPTYGPMAKMFSTETMYADASAIVAAAAPESLMRGLDHDLDIVETTMRRALAMTIYGGTSEIHRSLIAEKSLAMPKSRG